MEQPVEVSTLQGRLDSFSTEHHLSKRRASSVKKRTPQTVSWPHKSPRPAELARAGFFYKPTGDSDDNCMCFVCQRQLDGWEAGDDPVAEHLKHSPNCGWAIHASITETFKNGGKVTDDPMSEQFAQARLDTFGDLWPYEQKKGWKCKVAKMVAAGWCYDPSPEYNDGVTCSYCSLSLDGWEKNDDPFVEHQRRAPDCEFFTLLEEWSAAREQVKARKGRGRASRGSKASRLSTQSTVSMASEAPSQLSIGDEQAGEDDSILTTATNTTAKGRKKKATTAKGKGKAVRGKKAASLAVDDSVVLHSEAPAPADEPIEEEAVVVEPPKKQTRRKVSRNETSHIEETLNSSQMSKPTRTKSARGKAKQRLTEDESQLQTELQASVQATLVDREETSRPTRGTKRTSNGAPKLDSSIVFIGEAPSEPQGKAKRGRPPKNSARSRQSETEEQEENAGPRSSLASEPPQRISSLPTKGPKSKRAKKGARPIPIEPEPEIEPEIEVEPEMIEAEIHIEADFMEPEPEPEVEPEVAEPEPEPELEPEVAEIEREEEEEEEQDFDFAQSLVNPVNPYRPMESTPEPPEEEGEASTTPSTPTPARVRQPGSSSVIRQSHAATPLRMSVSHKEATPSSSPQSSDAENKPPSSRPESARPPLSVPRLPAQPVFAPPAPSSPQLSSTREAPATTRRVPLAETTPAHINRSPSKRNMLGGIKSALPWSPTALENIFLNSPVKSNLAASSSAQTSGAAHTFPNIDMETADLRTVVGAVKHVMTDAEKKMSVGKEGGH
ncbi:hypothetical protein FKW77_008425 [Venturia effusa]|uniref:BIR-domain-containing protein n=1 Tax=Venturia effusa TaxID=50376 RepID=A0A517KWZ9_9PEZI|nr:hypothetical protein FKW77_008425 [Venturia effusa]